MSYIFLAGASRGVGREIAKQLVIEGRKVLALLRSDNAEADLVAMGVTVVKGDALESVMMKQIMGDFPIEAVISTIGGLPEDGTTRADFVGNKNLIDAAAAIGAKRFILMSSIGSGDSAQALPENVLETLGPVLKEKAQAEAHLAASGLTYTVIRPGGLVSESATGQEVLTEDVTVAGSIPRAGVAMLTVRCLNSDKTSNKVFSAIDLSMQRTKKAVDVFEL
ncbi:MAG: SDR family oxidoreductase [Phormidesmis sp.]